MCITYHGDQVRVGGGGEGAASIQRPLHLPRQPGPHHRRGEAVLTSSTSLIIIFNIISLVITIVITAGCGRGPGRCPGSQHPLPRPQQQGGVRWPGRHQARGQARQGPGYMKQIFSSASQIFSPVPRPLLHARDAPRAAARGDAGAEHTLARGPQALRPRIRGQGERK